MFSFTCSKLKPFVVLTNSNVMKLCSVHNSGLQPDILIFARSIILIAQRKRIILKFEAHFPGKLCYNYTSF